MAERASDWEIIDCLREKAQTMGQMMQKCALSAREIEQELARLMQLDLVVRQQDRYCLNVKQCAALVALASHLSEEEPMDVQPEDSTRKELTELFFQKRETGFHHAPIERELAFYESVRGGNLETVKALFTPLGGDGFGVLCQDPLQNLKYHLVVSIAMITRFCIGGGMTPEEAYSLSDVYIRKTDTCVNHSEIAQIHETMTMDFTKRMRKMKNSHMYSKPVVTMLDYISDHLHERILVEQIAKAVPCTVPYASRLFHKEIGMPLSTYIAKKKIEAAANMLQFSDVSALDICNYLHFSSQSYFIKQFKKQLGMTPRAYRSKFDFANSMQPKK